MDQAVGMMDEGYFVSRSDILKWINNLLELNLTKIEMLGSGAVYCQLMDIIYPGHIAMNKVNWKAKLEYEFISNWKILQQAFIKLKIGRMIEVERLSKAKYQDNLEFAQWMKRFFEMKIGDKNKEYDAVSRRGGAEVDFSFAEKVVVPKIFNLATQSLAAANEPVPEKKRKSNNTATSAYSKESLMAEKKTSSLPMSNKENIKNAGNKGSSKAELQKVKDILSRVNMTDSEKVRELCTLLEIPSGLEKPESYSHSVTENTTVATTHMEEEEVL